MIRKYYPVALKIRGRKAVVIGGGEVAERKVAALMDAGAYLQVVSPDLTAKLKRLAVKGKICWKTRDVLYKDIRGAFIVIAATSDHKVNSRVSRWARSIRALVNVVDNQVLSNFISVALARKGNAIISVYTDGKDPALSRDLKNFLKDNWHEFISYRHRLPER